MGSIVPWNVMTMSSACDTDIRLESITPIADAVVKVLLKRMAFSLSFMSSRMTAHEFYQTKRREELRAREFFKLLPTVVWRCVEEPIDSLGSASVFLLSESRLWGSAR